MFANALEDQFTEIWSEVEAHYGSQSGPLAIAAYYEAFSEQGWSPDQLRQAIKITIRLEDGYGRIPTARKFIDRYLERRREDIARSNHLLTPSGRISCYVCQDEGWLNSPAIIAMLRDLRVSLDSTYRHPCPRCDRSGNTHPIVKKAADLLQNQLSKPEKPTRQAKELLCQPRR